MRWLALVCCLALGACRTAPKDTSPFEPPTSEFAPNGGLGSSKQKHKAGIKPQQSSRAPATATVTPRKLDELSQSPPSSAKPKIEPVPLETSQGRGDTPGRPPVVARTDADESSARSYPLNPSSSSQNTLPASPQPATIDISVSTPVVREAPGALALPQTPGHVVAERNEVPSISLWPVHPENVPHSNAVVAAPSLSLAPAPPGSNRAVAPAAELPTPGSSRLEAAKPGVPLMMPQWVEEKEIDWRESELERRTNQQKEREEQIQQLRRTLYRFLNVDAD